MAHQTVYRNRETIKRVSPTKDPSKYVVDKEKLKQDLLEYQTICNQAEAEGKPIPQIPDSIGLAFMKIATILSKKHYFINYTYIDEMVSDAIIKCCEAVRKFDPNAGTSAFAYYTQVCWYQFLERLKDEKKQKIVKAAIVQNIGTMLDDVATQEVDADSDFHTAMGEILALQSVEIDWKQRKQKEPVIEMCPVNLFDIEASELEVEEKEISE